MPSLSIRKASPADIPLIRELAFSIWPVTYQDILTPEQLDYMLNLLYSQKILQEQMEQQIAFIIVYDNESPVGFASFGSKDAGVYKLHKIYILASQQGKGTGRFIIEYVIDKIKAKGAHSLQLNVNRYNKAMYFYEKLGFVLIKEEDVDIGNGYFMNDYVMEKRLG